MYEFAPVDSGS
jgi:hypothetical protein